MEFSTILNYLLRLKSTSSSELIYRCKCMLFARKMRYFLLNKNKAVVASPLNMERLKQLKLPLLVSNIDRPKDSQVATLNTPRKSILQFEQDCRDIFFTNVGRKCDRIDIRSVWEPARLQHLTLDLFKANEQVSENKREKSLLRAKKNIEQWITDNPFLKGPHYMSPMECGLRIPVFFYCIKLLDDQKPEALFKIANSIYQHAWWIIRNLSLYNSLGNHTVCECIGLVYAGALYSDTSEGRHWLARGCEILDEEIDHQILPDGGPVEQSLNYHRFVLDLYWLASSFLSTNQLYDCRRWQDRLETGESFIDTFRLDDSSLLQLGDSDDGYAVAPGIFPQRFVPSHAADKIRTFYSTGYTVIRDGHLLFTFDHGPLGLSPLYNHGHADALSITMAYRGEQVLIDPGTFRYNGVPKWRRYFKSTRAHNTITIDGQDQANQASGFIWTKPFESRMIEKRSTDSEFVIEAYHNGYCRLTSQVRHFRKVHYFAPGTFLVFDRFTGKGWHSFELNFHLGKTQAIDKRKHWWRLEFEAFFVYLRVFESKEGAVVSGNIDPPIGWNSPAYGIKHPSNAITYERSGIASNIIFTTAIVIQEKEQDFDHATAA